MTDRTTLALIAVGGAVGTLGRYGLSEAFPVARAEFPTTTLVVNVVGALALGLLLGLLGRVPRRAYRLQPLLAIGVLGGFTTYSTFSVETVQLHRAGADGLALGYMLASVVAGMAAAAVGLHVARPGDPVIPDGDA